MGSKNRIAKDILPIMLEGIGDNYFIDAFCGGGNLIKHANCKNKIASDINPYTIAFLQKIQKTTHWIHRNNKEFTEENYNYVKNNKEKYLPFYLGHVGYNLSFGGIWFKSYSKDKKGRDYVKYGYNHAVNQSKKIKDVTFLNQSYLDLNIPDNSVIYCDIPYKGTYGYVFSKKFDYEQFYNWCYEQKNKGHKIFISEYSMPEGFVCVWEKEMKTTLNDKGNSKKVIEKLFTLPEYY